MQVLFAYGVATLIAYLYERVRTRQELLLVEQATQDFLTGLPNRRGFSQLADVLARQAQRHRQPLAIVLFDIDDFKGVNDRFGHPAGDALLRDTGQLVREQARSSDVVARWGGEEFIVLLPYCDLARAAALTEKLRSALGIHTFPEIGRITASFGLAEARSGETLDALVERDDAALYRAKHNGKNRVETDPPGVPPARPLTAGRRFDPLTDGLRLLSIRSHRVLARAPQPACRPAHRAITCHRRRIPVYDAWARRAPETTPC